MNIIQFLKEAKENGGGSYSFLTGQTNPTAGYMVSMAGRERIIKELQVKEVQVYVTENRDVLMTEGAYLGVWASEGEWYLDVSRNITDRATAISAGNDNKQQAIWDCAKGEEIALFPKN